MRDAYDDDDNNNNNNNNDNESVYIWTPIAPIGRCINQSDAGPYLRGGYGFNPPKC